MTPINHFTLVFDASTRAVDWDPAYFALLISAAGAWLMWNRVQFEFLPATQRYPAFFRKYFPHVIFFGASAWLFAFLFATITTQRRYTEQLQGNLCRTVEGRVTDYKPQPVPGHGNESFVVAGVKFEYLPDMPNGPFDDRSPGFNYIIAKQPFVRLCYDIGNHDILRLEVAD